MQLRHQRGWRRTVAAIVVGLTVTIAMLANTATSANADDAGLPYYPNGPSLALQVQADAIHDSDQSDLVGMAGAQCAAMSIANGLNVRVAPLANADSVGQLYYGYVVPWDCWLYVGDQYTACGDTSDLWAGVYWNGTWGFAAATCLVEA